MAAPSLIDAYGKLPTTSAGVPDPTSPAAAAWRQDVLAAMPVHEHWLCTPDCQPLALQLLALDMAVQGPEQVPPWWHDKLVPDLATCLHCVVTLHDAMVRTVIPCTLYRSCSSQHPTQGEWESSLPIEHATPLCTVLQRCNLQRLEQQLRGASGLASHTATHAVAAPGSNEKHVPLTVVNALFEALEYDLGRDAGVAAALTTALMALTTSHDLDLRQGGRYKGLLRLLAHPDPSVRSMVRCSY